MSDILKRRRKFGHRNTGRTPCGDGGRDWSDTSIGRGTLVMADYYQNRGERIRTDYLSEFPEETNLIYLHLVFGLPAPRTVK